MVFLLYSRILRDSFVFSAYSCELAGVGVELVLEVVVVVMVTEEGVELAEEEVEEEVLEEEEEGATCEGGVAVEEATGSCTASGS